VSKEKHGIFSPTAQLQFRPPRVYMRCGERTWICRSALFWQPLEMKAASPYILIELLYSIIVLASRKWGGDRGLGGWNSQTLGL
jgi:hypothetical protein